MNGFIWPSDSARAENDELQRACEYLEQVLEERDELRKLAYIGEHMHEDCSWKFRFAEIRKERDALAAHVERLRSSFDAANTWEDVKEVFSDTPDVSLAHLKAQWQAEAVSDFAFHHLGSLEQESAEIYASKLRRQAEDKSP